MQSTVDVRVVVADPVSAARASFRRIIEESWGWKVVGDTGDAFEAVSIARRAHADLVLVDVAISGLPTGEIRSLLEESGALVVVLLERPEQHAGHNGPSVLKSVPSDVLHDRVVEQLRAHWSERFPRPEVRR